MVRRKKLLLLSSLFLYGGVLSLRAQLASYDFDADAIDQVGDYDASSFGTPTFVNGEYISLNEDDYLSLPTSLSSAIDISSSFEIRVRFKVEGDYEATEGEEARIILSSKDEYDQRMGGFDITARQWEGQLRIITTYGDGLAHEPGSCPSCCSDCVLSEGKLDFVSDIEPGIWYDFVVKFFFDSEVPYIQYEVNNAVSISYFDDRVDFEGFRSTVDQRQIWVGANRDNEILTRMDPTMQMDIDYLTFSSPIPPGDQTVVGNVLQILTDDIQGTTSLTAAEIDSLHSLFVQNWDGNSFDANRGVILNYMDTYAENHDYIFNEDFKERVEDFPPKEAIQYTMQQWIIDNQYGPLTVSEMEGVVFKDHEWFPGAVSSDAPRENGATFVIDADYQTDPGFVLNGQEYARRPSGYYVAPGELVTVSVPESAVNQGLTLYVGAHDANVQETWSEFSRFPRISTKYELTSSSMAVTNPFGGGIYITVPEGAQLGPLEFVVNGAVKAPYYSMKPGFSNLLEDFQADVANQYVPWIDMESSNFMCTISHGMASMMTDPDSILSIWDQSFDAFNVALGRPLERFRSEYIIVDKQNHVKFTAAPASYPMSLETVARPYDPSLDMPIEVQEGRHWYRDVLGAFHFIISHEYGHLHNMPTLYHEQEANVNMPAAAIYNLVMGESIDSAFVYSIQQRLNFEQAALDWILTPIFYKGYRMGLDTINYESFGDAIQMSYQSRGFAKLVDIAKMFGWEALGDIMGYFYEYKLANPEWDPYGLGDDEFIEAASLTMGFNMAPHFEFWGILPSQELVDGLDTMQTSDVIKERIIHYRRQVPRNNAEFQPIHQVITSKIGPHHHVRYDAMKTAYDETTAEAIIARIDTILGRYYEIDDTDFNAKPVITGVVESLSTTMGTPLTLELSDFQVEDSDNDFPNDFSLAVLDGNNYSVSGTTIAPKVGYVGELSVPVKVNDGLEDSEEYLATVSVTVLNIKPVITGLVTSLTAEENSQITLTLSDFVVEDSDSDFPDDFALNVFEGDNYTLTGATVTPATDFVGTLSVPVTVHDDIDESEQYLATIEVIEVLGVEDQFVHEHFSIHPNPVSNLLVLEVETEVGTYEAMIYSMHGDLLMSSKRSDTKEEIIDLSSVDSGIYILQIRSGNKIGNFKVIKK